ncbi:hypothetical protein PMAYCL1PPCAC_27065, partial [Pristionchus mayeri]
SLSESKGIESARRLQVVAPLTLREDRAEMVLRSLSQDVLCCALAKNMEQCIVRAASQARA